LTTQKHSRIPARERLIVALDLPDSRSALALADELREEVTWFKVGLELYTAAGPPVVEELRRRGAHVFLDLKLHDIPTTVERAVARIAHLGASLTTLHAGGGRAMLEAAVRGREASPGNLRLLAVTVLTSLDAAALDEVGVAASPADQALRLARLAAECDVDGAVCSPLEAEPLRAALSADFLLVTPGIRAAGEARGDQARVAGPAEALRRGATHLVVGRPVTRADSPREAARRMIAALEESG
jgi:orotidine-5'-phosphate decarboxylase